MKEIWKDIPGYEGHYQASNLGKIRSLNYLGHRGIVKILKTHLTYDGYERVSLILNKKKKLTTVHILVAKTFIPNPYSKPQVNHIDGVKTNNTVENLEWVTGKENIQHSIINGLRRPDLRIYKKGSSHQCSKSIYQYSLNGDFIKKWDCISDAARYFDCLPATLVNCSKGRIKSCKGFMWRQFEKDPPHKIEPFTTKDYPRLIIQKTLDGQIVKKWNGYKQIREESSYRCGDICSCCKGVQKTAYGFIWEEIPIAFY